MRSGFLSLSLYSNWMSQSLEETVSFMVGVTGATDVKTRKISVGLQN